MSRFSAAELEQRVQGIGGSEAAAALGLSNTVTPIDLYRHKVFGEPLPMHADEMALWLGTQLEPVCAAAFTKHTGMELENHADNIVHPDYPFMRGFIDRKVKGKNEGVELKAWSEFSRSLWGPDGSDDVPMPVLCQAVHYMIAAQFDCWHVGVLLGTEFRAYTIFPSDDVVDMVIDGERKFWQCVLDKVAPPAINVRDLHYLYKRARPGSTRTATPKELVLHHELCQAKSRQRNTETRISNLEFELKKSLKDTARLTHPNDDNYTLLSWNEHRKRVANSAAIKKTRTLGFVQRRDRSQADAVTGTAVSDKDTIRKAVELADGWEYWGNDYFVVDGIELLAPENVIKDAIAAQLVRQVEVLDKYGVMQWAFNDVEIREYHATDNPLESEEIVASAEGPDRTMNTIKAIVDSGVLEK